MSPSLNVMYSLNSESLKKLSDTLFDTGSLTYTTQLEREVHEAFMTYLHSAKTSSLALNENIDIVDPSLNATIVNTLDGEEFLSSLRNRFDKMESNGILEIITRRGGDRNSALSFRQRILDLADKTLKEISILKGEYKNSQERDTTEMIGIFGKKYTNLDDDTINGLQETAKEIQTDTNWFISQLGNTSKLSNIFAKGMSWIIDSLENSKIYHFNNDMETYVNKLKAFRDNLKNYVRDGYFRSGIDTKKLFEDQRKFEFEVFSKMDPNKYPTYEDYLKAYQEFGDIPVKKTSGEYFKFRYLYDTMPSARSWMTKEQLEYLDKRNKMISEMGFIGNPWNDPFYEKLIRRSNARKEDNKFNNQMDKADANPYYENGELKKGFKAMTYAKALEAQSKRPDFEILSTQYGVDFDTTFPNPTDIVFVMNHRSAEKDALMTYYTLKWNKIRAKYANIGDTKNTIFNNFKQAYEDKILSLRSSNMTEDEINSELKKWLDGSLLFEPSESYWAAFDGQIFDYNKVLNSSAPSSVKEKVREIRDEYSELQLRKSLLMKRFKDQSDYKEIDVDSMSSTDKATIENIEAKMQKLRNDLTTIYNEGEFGEIYKGGNSSSKLRLNSAFYSDFEIATGKDFMDDSVEDTDIAIFFGNIENFNNEKYSRYIGLRRDLKAGRNNGLIDIYTDIARENGLGTDEKGILRAFLMSNSPSWYKRYDANENYDNFIKAYNKGAVSMVDLIEGYINTGGKGNVTYVDNTTGSRISLTDMVMSPSFKFSLPPRPDVKALSDSYKSIDNSTKENLMTKYNLLRKMADTDRLNPIYKENMDDIISNENTLREYIEMMDAQVQRLTRDNMLRSDVIFLMPQVRKSSYERAESFVKDKGKLDQVTDYIKEMFSFREDDYEEAHRSSTIPRYGYYRLSPEELTDDVLFSLVWGLNNANYYEQRVKHWGDALGMMKGLDAQEFQNGKRSTDSHYHKIMQEMMDFSFYGKTTSGKIKFEVPIPGRDPVKIDLSKFLFSIKNLSISTALAFSPIVAATNFSSGVIQNAIMAAVGRNVYSPSNKRAVGVVAQLTPETLSDIGRFDPQAKLNKILYNFGIYDRAERFENAKFGKLYRLVPQASFSMMAATNFPLQSQATLTKLMEYRLINGNFKNWRQFSLEMKTINPSITNDEIKSEFDKHESLSMYDFLDDNGVFDQDLLDKEGYKGRIEKDQVIAMSDIRNITEMTTMEIAKHHEAAGGRNPVASFALSLKKWLIMATSTMTSRKTFDFATGGQEEGLMYTPAYLFKMFKKMREDDVKFAEAYDSLSEVERKNIKAVGVTSALMLAMLAVAIILKNAADDDEDEENYLLQLSAYMAMRNLNESFSGNIGIGEAYLGSIENPVMAINTMKNMKNFFAFGDIGEEVDRGKYKGEDKYWTGIMKATWLRNPYTMMSTHALSETRKSYEFFNKNDSFYHIFDLIPEKEKDEE